MMRNRIISSTFLLALLGVVIATAHATEAARIEALMDHARRLAGQKQFAQAANTYRRVLSIDPDHAVAYRNIWKIDRALGVPDNPALRPQLARDFGEGFFLSASEHYLILYDGRHSWADSRARTLELAYDQFHDQMRKAGFKPVPLQHRMVCLMFNTHDDYLAYAREVDRIEHNWSSGYYSQRTNRVSFFNIHYSPQLKDTVLEIQKLENEVQRLVGEAAQDKRQQGRLNSARARLSAHRRAYERAAAYGNIQQT
ncbi:MAG: hypothetical protein MI802_23100, partial [Desulfobacterales bacterium]|nr:hypothetical protein [Desulfobacterales bacterium]